MLSLIKTNNKSLLNIVSKVNAGERISIDETIYLFENAELGLLAFLADNIKQKLHGKKVYYNKNFHIEPTNICVFQCDFCSFSTLNEKAGWRKTQEDIISIISEKTKSGAKELHMTGGANPDYDLEFYTNLFFRIKLLYPDLHIKAFTAVEVDYISKLESKSINEVLMKLKEAGLDSMPGGGAEIFDEDIRKKICLKKTSGKKWLEVHEAAHKIGLSSNATILYGHIENISHRIAHLDKLRSLQDKTKGFKAFIPLKFRNKNNKLSAVPETTLLDDIKTFAISRIFLDNIPHIKAYWPMLGKNYAQLMLHFGVNDLDGTIQDSTKIYSMAGVDENKPKMTDNEIKKLIEIAGFEPVERDSLYNAIS